MLKSKMKTFNMLAEEACARGGMFAELGQRLKAFCNDFLDKEFVIWCAANGEGKIIKLMASSGIPIYTKFEYNNKEVELDAIAEENGRYELANEIRKLAKKQKSLTSKLYESAKLGALHNSVKEYYGKKVQLMGIVEAIEAGAVVDGADYTHTTALIYAAQHGRRSVVKALIAAGADVNAADFMGATPLMWAAYGDDFEIVKMLVEAGADVNAVDKENGSTPLIWWATNSHDNVRAVEYLVQHGAKFDATIDRKKARRRKTLDNEINAYDFALAKANFKIADYLDDCLTQQRRSRKKAAEKELATRPKHNSKKYAL